MATIAADSRSSDPHLFIISIVGETLGARTILKILKNYVWIRMLNMDFWILTCEIHFVPAEPSTPSSARDLVHQSGSRRFFPVFALNIP